MLLKGQVAPLLAQLAVPLILLPFLVPCSTHAQLDIHDCRCDRAGTERKSDDNTSERSAYVGLAPPTRDQAFLELLAAICR